MWLNPQFPANLVTFTEEILNGKLQFLCSVTNNSACEPLVYNDPTFFVIVVVTAAVLAVAIDSTKVSLPLRIC